MREEDSNWFSNWEEQLLPPEELTPLSETLISRDLALAFNIHPTAANLAASAHFHHRNSSAAPRPPPSSGDFDSSSAELGGCGGDEPARTLKRPRLVWTPQLHKRFVDAVAHLGIKNAVPKTIMQLMSVDGLTRENVASHLQKYRLYLKRMQGIGNSGGGVSGDSATDHLFASSPIPAHFLHPQGSSGGGGGVGGRSNSAHSEHFLGYVPPPATVAALHQQQVAAMVAGGQYHHHHHRQVGHFGSPTSGVGHPFLSRQAQMGGARLGFSNGGGGGGGGRNSVSGYEEDLDSGTAASGRKVLTLFPSD